MGEVRFIDKANKEYGGVVFGITAWTKDQWSQSGPSLLEVGLGHNWKIGESEDRVFILSTPSDVEYNPHDEKLSAEYKSMSDHVNNIKTSFKINN